MRIMLEPTEPVVTVRNHTWYSRRHHNERGGFRNLWGRAQRPVTAKSSAWIVLQLLLTDRGLQLLTGRPINYEGKGKRVPFARLCDEALRRPPRGYRVSWLGHSTCLLQINERFILTDPVFSSQIGPLPVLPALNGGNYRLERGLVMRGPRQPGLPLPVEHIPRLDTIIISHCHYDHLDKASIIQLYQRFRPRVLVPLGVKKYVQSWGIDGVVELDWWQYVEMGGLRYHCTPARHLSQRRLRDRNQTLWSGWLVEDADSDNRVFFAGDTAYSPHFTQINETLGPPDVALLPIGAYSPRWHLRDVHTDPEEALQAFLDLGAEHFIGIHWGTFDLGAEPLHEPGEITPKLAREKGVAIDKVHILPIGGSFTS